MFKKYVIAGRLAQAEIEIRSDVTRETESMIFYIDFLGKERREAKMGQFKEHYDSWEQAHAALSGRARRKLASAQASLRYAEKFVADVAAMKAPE